MAGVVGVRSLGAVLFVGLGRTEVKEVDMVPIGSCSRRS